ncbi:hypothetical protein, partial [Methanoregula sp. PtaB.Bin085]
MTDQINEGQEKTALVGKGTIALITGIVIIIAALIVTGLMQTGGGPAVLPADCAARSIAYINNNLVSQGTSVTFESVTETKGLYEIKARFQSEEIAVYATKDCTLLFTNVVNMSGGSGATRSAAETPVPVKTVRPSVDLYVMSFCPYGTQAETVMKPVVDLLGSKADIRIRYITTVTGTTVDSVDSLHGKPEAKEDLFQACINKYYPDKYWTYLDMFNKNCYPSWQDASVLEPCRRNTTAAVGIDHAKIETCAGGADGLALLKADETSAEKDRATASPMLFINGVKYSGARTPEAF